MINIVKKLINSYLPTRILSALIGFFSIILYSNLFSPEEYGEFSLAIGIINLMLIVLNSWISQATLRLHYEMKEYNNYFTTLWNIMANINLIVLIISIPIIYNLRSDFNILMILGIILFCVQSIDTTLQSILRVEDKVIAYNINSIILSVSKTIIVYLLATILRLGVESIILSLIIAYLFSVIISFKAIYKKKKLKYCRTIDRKILNKMMSYGIPLAICSIISWIISLSDRYMIAWLSNNDSVGIYSMGYSIANTTIGLIITIFMLGDYPKIVQVWEEKGKKHTEKEISKMLHRYLAIVIPAVIGIFWLAEDIMKILGNKEYIATYKILPWVSMGILVMGINNYYNKYWELQKKSINLVICNFTAAIINVILNMLLIPRYGYIVAAITTLITYIIYLIIIILKTHKEFKIPINNIKIFEIMISSLLMCMCLYLIDRLQMNYIYTVIISILIGSIVYFSSLIGIKYAKGVFN